MGKTKLDETYIKSALKCNSFDVAIGIKIPFFRVLVTIEPVRSLLQFVTTNCLMSLGPEICEQPKVQSQDDESQNQEEKSQY